MDAIRHYSATHEEGQWRRTPPAERAAVLDAIARRLAERMDEMAALQVLENGTTLRQAGAFHLGFSIAHLQYFADLARRYDFERPGPLLPAIRTCGRWPSPVRRPSGGRSCGWPRAT